MTTHSSILAWRIPWTEEPVGLLSIGSHRVRHDWSDVACVHALEKEMATHSSILAWRIPGTEDPGALPSMGSHKVRHNRSDLAAAATAAWIENFLLQRLILSLSPLPNNIDYLKVRFHYQFGEVHKLESELSLVLCDYSKLCLYSTLR